MKLTKNEAEVTAAILLEVLRKVKYDTYLERFTDGGDILIALTGDDYATAVDALKRLLAKRNKK